MRLSKGGDGPVRVHCHAASRRAASNCNCVVARRGGAQRNENGQSITLIANQGRSEFEQLSAHGVESTVGLIMKIIIALALAGYWASALALAQTNATPTKPESTPAPASETQPEASL